jgi:S-formylglutathione hydrolase FrmB
MGGYGAFKCALARPDRYAAAASFSGVMDFPKALQGWDFLQARISEDSANAAPSNLFVAAEQLMALSKLSNDVKVPMLYQECGTEDFLYSQNIAFRDLAQKLGMPYEYHERPGTHNWEFWNECIRKTLAWLPLQTETNKTSAIGV